MFTGIIEQLGAVKANGFFEGKIAIEAQLFSDGKIGQSISINGACLTIVELKGKLAIFDVSPETQRRTNLGSLRTDDKVNLERALKVNDRFDGHFVLGHVDCVGKIVNIKRQPSSAKGAEMEIEIPAELMKYIVEKGSVAVDGVSLTVGEIEKRSFTLCLIPHTLKATTLGLKNKGDSVNVEADLLGKYVERFSKPQHRERITQDFLQEHGFI